MLDILKELSWLLECQEILKPIGKHWKKEKLELMNRYSKFRCTLNYSYSLL